MMCRRLLIAAIAVLGLASSARAQPPADTAVTFGNKLSLATIASAMQAGGFQALVAPRPPNLPDVILGVITSGMNGANVTVIIGKCDNSKTDDVCGVSFMVSFTDDKNIVNDALLASINTKLVYAKATRIVRTTDQKPLLTVTYNYIVKDFTDTKFIVPVMTNFSQDMGRAAAAYNAAAQPAQAPAK